MVRGLAVAVASLIMANGVILTQEATGLDFGDAIEDSGAALLGLLKFDKETSDLGAMRPDGTTSTTSGQSAVDGTSSSTSSTVPGEVPSETTATSGGTGTTSGTSTRGTTKGTSKGTKNSGTPSTPGATPSEVTVTTTAGGTATTQTTAPPAPTPEQQIIPLQAFVEQYRGLSFTGPVKITKLAEGPFKSRLAEYRLGDARREAERLQGVMRALGIIKPGVDLPAEVSRLAAGQATLFYDAEMNELVIRGDLTTAFSRKTLVHELTNALNDQHFELHRPQLRQNNDETNVGFISVAEGIATRIENRYVLGLGDDDKRAIQAEQQRLAAQFPKDLPSIVFVTFGFPYTAGLRMVNALADAGGPARMDDLFRQPPTTSEQVIHPDRYLNGQGGKAIPFPAADGPVVRQGTMGQLALSIMLAEGLEADYAEDAADGWAGDSYVSWAGANGQTCARITIEMDTPDDTTVMGEALTDWSEEMGAVVEGAGPFTVTRCA